MRQLAKPDGAVALSVSYTPWGDTLEVYGTGMLDIGYLGGEYDAGTGLIYMGNGQYFDPSTGRFLTRGAQPDQSNPYTPWNNDPSGMLIAPLALLALVFGRKKNRTKLDHFVILLVIGLSVGLSVSACGGVNTPKVQIFITPITTPSSTAMPAQPGTDDGDMPDEPIGVSAENPELSNCASSNINTLKYDFLQFALLFGPDRIKQYFGEAPDWRGIFIAARYKDLIEKYANQNDRVSPMMVAVGIAIQGNYSGNIVDVFQEGWIRVPGMSDDHTAFGIGGFTQKQILELFIEPTMTIEQVKKIFGEGIDPRNAEVAIHAMVERIDKVISNKEVSKCSETDKMIFATFAQQDQNYDPVDNVLFINGEGKHPF